MCGAVVFTIIGFIISFILSKMGVYLKAAIFAPLFAMVAMIICMSLSKDRLRNFADVGWEEVLKIDQDLNDSYLEEFYKANYGIFVPMTFSIYRYSPMRRGESAAEAVWLQIIGSFVIFYSVYQRVYIAAVLAALMILLNLFVFKFPAVFYSDSHKDNIIRCRNNYMGHLIKQQKELKHFFGGSLNLADKYTTYIAETDYRKIVEVLDKKFSW